MKKIIITVLSAFLFSATTTFAGNDDNSNKLAGSEISLIEVANLKNNSAYWSGTAKLANQKSNGTPSTIRIEVYTGGNKSGSNWSTAFVAYVTHYGTQRLGSAQKCQVEKNPKYGSNAKYITAVERNCEYMINYKLDTWYFNM